LTRAMYLAVCKDTDDVYVERVEAAALVKPGRAISLNGCKRHAVRPISRYCNALRIALVFGAEVS
ncbi:MAG: hypothetical protein EBV34_17995, partial [Betaproteobacteria bacterium]|nr:hypothetical protein [Betaproteobacteria bacterium]